MDGCRDSSTSAVGFGLFALRPLGEEEEGAHQEADGPDEGPEVG